MDVHKKQCQFDRSPGGTPLKTEALSCEMNDHAAVFARALKRKFSLCPVGSPDSEKENTPVRHSEILCFFLRCFDTTNGSANKMIPTSRFVLLSARSSSSQENYGKPETAAQVQAAGECYKLVS